MAGAAAGLVMAMAKVDYFWIANVIYLGFVLWAVAGSVLRFARGEMTQAELAQRIGVTRQTIIAIEQGRYSPSLEVAFQTAGVFKVPLDEVFQYPEGESR